MLVDLTGRTALVTGGSQGLGLAMARRFALSGADVAILARTPDILQAAAESLAKESGRDVRGLVCDVRDPEAVSNAWRQAEQAFGRVDILVNNAGTSARGPFSELTRNRLYDDIDMKLAPALQLAQLAAPGMRQRRWGRILNVVNIGGKAPPAASAPTSMTRAAGLAMTKILASELAPDNVLVNALCVGTIRSEQWVRRHRSDRPEISYEQYLQEKAASIPLGRVGRADEFAQMACFLASDLASFVAGVAINVDGGASPVL